VYNSNPTAAKQVLHAFAQTPTTGHRIVVLGDMLELGDASPRLHASLADEFDAAAISDVYLIGPQMKVLYERLIEAYGTEHLHHYDVENKQQLMNDLEKQIQPTDVVMLKASHGIHLETVLQNLAD
jgi:UDP-N-acetylmuramoyl-tripeptide--D-alanyl-D-alanine ligase